MGHGDRGRWLRLGKSKEQVGDAFVHRDLLGSRATVAAGQELASRNGLHRFAQAHLVGEERAFGESEMQHAFALVRQQRIVQQVEAGRAGLDLGKEARARLLARRLSARTINPWRKMPRDANAATDVGWRGPPGRDERLDCVGVRRKTAIGLKE